MMKAAVDEALKELGWQVKNSCALACPFGGARNGGINNGRPTSLFLLSIAPNCSQSLACPEPVAVQ